MERSGVYPSTEERVEPGDELNGGGLAQAQTIVAEVTKHPRREGTKRRGELLTTQQYRLTRRSASQDVQAIGQPRQSLTALAARSPSSNGYRQS